MLRAHWPRYHRLAVFVGTALTLFLVQVAHTGALPSIYSLLLTALAALMTLCFVVALRLINLINAARDAGNEAVFERPHRLDVLLVGAGGECVGQRPGREQSEGKRAAVNQTHLPSRRGCG